MKQHLREHGKMICLFCAVFASVALLIHVVSDGILVVRAERLESRPLAKKIDTVSEPLRVAEAVEEKPKVDPKKERADKLRETLIQCQSTLPVAELTDEDLLKAERVLSTIPVDMRSAAAVSYYSRRFGLRTSFVIAVMEQESCFNQYTVGTHQDRGFMQIIPSTERFIAKSYGPGIGLQYNPERIFEAEYNIALSTAYLGDMNYQYQGDNHRMLSEYNRGSGKLATYYRKNGTYATSYSKSVLAKEQKYLELNQ